MFEFVLDKRLWYIIEFKYVWLLHVLMFVVTAKTKLLCWLHGLTWAHFIYETAKKWVSPRIALNPSTTVL